jgi:hypothetical protein
MGLWEWLKKVLKVFEVEDDEPEKKEEPEQEVIVDAELKVDK